MPPVVVRGVACPVPLATGSNQYHCERCGLQDAVRSVQVKKLPRVLVLKLMRFVYDPKKGARQKVPTAVGYPLALQLGPLGVDVGGRRCKPQQTEKRPGRTTVAMIWMLTFG